MKVTSSALSPIRMIVFLETITFILENFPCSLSAYERYILTQFGILVAENMVLTPEGPITISLSSDTKTVFTELRGYTRLHAAKRALEYHQRGLMEKSTWEPSNQPQRPTSQDTSSKNTEQTVLPLDGRQNSHE